jgi:hypothetical protein
MYLPTYLPTYVPTYINWIFNFKKKCHMVYFDYAKWQYVNGLYFSCEMGINCKLHMNGQQIKSYMLIMYIIHK